MFIAHLPAGYVMARGLLRCGGAVRGVMPACLVGALLPDMDLFWCYLVDKGQFHHHGYVTHWPVLWVGLLLGAAFWYVLRKSSAAVVVLALSGSALLHVLLDGVVGDVQLFAPWSREYYALATVPAVYRPWWLNFFLHWSMLLELLICAWAFRLFRSRKKMNER